MSRISPLMRKPTRHYKDRRESPRLQTFLRTDYCRFIRRADGLEVYGMRRAVATDLSATGLQLSGVGYLKERAMVKLYLRLPDVPASPIVCYGRVVRAVEDGVYGLRLMRLRESDRVRLTRFVRVQLARSQRATPPLPVPIDSDPEIKVS